ncbi:MAG: CoA transferase [Deltaproteobacteria bacterium]|nr:CoA transferase [Deltaproteobacteria bacterium]
MAGPLAGLKILDLSRLLPGPYCSLMLADLGADVLKIEAPQVGDYMRWWGPRVKKQGAFFLGSS